MNKTLIFLVFIVLLSFFSCKELVVLKDENTVLWQELPEEVREGFLNSYAGRISSSAVINLTNNNVVCKNTSIVGLKKGNFKIWINDKNLIIKNNEKIRLPFLFYENKIVVRYSPPGGFKKTSSNYLNEYDRYQIILIK